MIIKDLRIHSNSPQEASLSTEFPLRQRSLNRTFHTMARCNILNSSRTLAAFHRCNHLLRLIIITHRYNSKCPPTLCKDHLNMECSKAGLAIKTNSIYTSSPSSLSTVRVSSRCRLRFTINSRTKLYLKLSLNKLCLNLSQMEHSKVVTPILKLLSNNKFRYRISTHSTSCK